MGVQLVTFGGLHALDGATTLEPLLTQRSRAALLVCLTIERRIPRDALMGMFWPESDSRNARHALRQALYHLRRALGDRDWIDSRAHELLVRDEIQADATTFSGALECGDVGRAVRLYRGPFLSGVHLADLPSWESWVDARRAWYARAFRKACRDLLNGKIAERDLAGAVAVAERWMATDPTDDEAQHRLIATLAQAGERADAIRQYDVYSRLLAPDGLEPLDETRQLVDQLRTDRRRAPARRGFPDRASASLLTER
jgi:DNA-binding SARP family transcriptional activator